jgi:hypothetical protein
MRYGPVGVAAAPGHVSFGAERFVASSELHPEAVDLAKRDEQKKVAGRGVERGSEDPDDASPKAGGIAPTHGRQSKLSPGLGRSSRFVSAGLTSPRA